MLGVLQARLDHGGPPAIAMRVGVPHYAMNDHNPKSMMALLPSASGDVAWWAHVGGFIAGFALGPLLVRSHQGYRVYYPDEGVFGFDTKGRI